MPGGDRSGADAVLLAQLATGSTVKDAASAAGVSESTGYRRLRDPEFASQLADARAQVVAETIAMLVSAGPRAVQTLVELLDEPTPAPTRRNAARDILAYIVELGAVPDLRAELEAIKRALGISGNGAPA